MSNFLFVKGQVITMEREGLIYPACAVKEDRICGVGEPDFLRGLLGEEYEEVDLKGGVLLPGFVDCHFHVVMGCFFKMNLDLMGMGVSSIDELLNLFRERVSEAQPGKWIQGLRLNELDLQEKRYPSLAELDEVAPDNPVLIMRYDGHSGLANSRALELAGVDQDTPDPPGGEICKVDGKLTGLLKEKAMTIILNVVPMPEAEELLKGRDLLREALLSQGITGYHNIMLTSEDGPSGALGPYEIPLFKMFEDGLPFRNYPLINANTVSDTIGVLEKEFNAKKVDGVWQGGVMKLFADGTFGSRTAQLFEDYSDSAGEKGYMVGEIGQLRKTIFEAHREGLRIAVHTIGDRAVDQIARIFLDAEQQIGQKQLRHRIEHCSMVQPETVEVLKNAGVICSMQPSFIVSEGSWIRDRVGKRVKFVYPMKTLLDQAIPMCGGSDAPVEVPEPLVGIGGSVTRDGFTDDQALTPYEALALYTSQAAYASCQEQSQGTITPGKKADLVVLDQNPTEISPQEIKNIKVRLTMIDGKVEYQV